MRWFQRETRAKDESLTERIIDNLRAAALGSVSPGRTATVEIASGLFYRAFAAAVVEDAPAYAVEALTPSVLGAMGRALIRRGESVWQIVVSDGRLTLRPASSSITGGPDPTTWRYLISTPGPSITTSLTVPADGVVHVKHETDLMKPWKGVSPLDAADVTSAALASSRGVHGARERANERDAHTFRQWHSVAERGAARRVDRSARAGQHHTWPRGRTLRRTQTPIASRMESHPLRSIIPDDSVVTARTHLSNDILGACGIPVALVSAASDGTSQRESLRRFLHGTVAPLARAMSHELAAKLNAPALRLSFAQLFAADVAGRARAYAQLIGTGMAPDEAVQVAGLDTI